MTKILIGTTLAFALIAAPAFAQSNSPAGTGGGAGGESGSSSATPSQQGQTMQNKGPANTTGNSGATNRNGGSSPAGTGGGSGGESGSGSATEKPVQQRGNPSTPAK